MGTTEIIILIVVVLTIAVFVVVGFDNGKKIKTQQQKDKEKAAAEKAKAEEKPSAPAVKEATTEKVKKIVEENSIAVENYIKETLLNDELAANKNNSDIVFEEVSKAEVIKKIDSEADDNAIIIGKKQSVLHTFADDEEDEDYTMGTQSSAIIDELDNNDDAVISKKYNKFNVETNLDEDEKSVGEEINGLSNKAKAIIVSDLINKNDD